MSAIFSHAELCDLFTEVGSHLRTTDGSDAVLQLVADLAAERVPGAEYAGITVGREGSTFSTVAATDDLVRRTDSIQYELGTGPCVDAIVDNTVYSAPDLERDERWPQFGRRAVAETGIRSMLSMRLYMETEQGLIAGLNMYAQREAAFDDASRTVATLLATHGSLAAARAASDEKVKNLVRALETSRDIGVAMGIVMANYKLTRDQAFDLLRIGSQHTHRKIADIAAEIAETGQMPEIPNARSAPRPAD